MTFHGSDIGRIEANDDLVDRIVEAAAETYPLSDGDIVVVTANVANYHAREVWDETGEIPDGSELKSEMKGHPKYRLDNWPYRRLTSLVDYEARERGIKVEVRDGCGTSSACSVCRHEDGDDRVEPGLWKCSRCEAVACRRERSRQHQAVSDNHNSPAR